MTDAAGSASWLYDAMGRRQFNGATTNTIDMTTVYTYNLDGSVATLTYPSGRTITYAPGVRDGLYLPWMRTTASTTLWGQPTLPGAPSSLLLGQTDSFGGINLNQGYNNRLQPSSIRGWSTNGCTGI